VKWENGEKKGRGNDGRENMRNSLASQTLKSLPSEAIKGGREGDVNSPVSLESF